MYKAQLKDQLKDFCSVEATWSYDLRNQNKKDNSIQGFPHCLGVLGIMIDATRTKMDNSIQGCLSISLDTATITGLKIGEPEQLVNSTQDFPQCQGLGVMTNASKTTIRLNSRIFSVSRRAWSYD